MCARLLSLVFSLAVCWLQNYGMWPVDGNLFLGFGADTVGHNALADLWQSSDLGASWQQVSATNSPVGARVGATSVVVGGNLLQCGGRGADGTTYYNDCYYLPTATSTLILWFNDDNWTPTIYPPFSQSLSGPYTIGALTGQLSLTAVFSGTATYSLNDLPPPAGGLTSGTAKAVDVVAGCTNQLTVYVLASVYRFFIGAGPLCPTSIPVDAT